MMMIALILFLLWMMCVDRAGCVSVHKGKIDLIRKLMPPRIRQLHTYVYKLWWLHAQGVFLTIPHTDNVL